MIARTPDWRGATLAKLRKKLDQPGLKAIVRAGVEHRLAKVKAANTRK